MDGLITPDELAGCPWKRPRARAWSRGRTGPASSGPSPKKISTPAEVPLELLVQNVEQFHPDTATLLRAFNFAPRWLMDDIMVSFSTRVAGIGGHVDSYHVFLVQGQGARRWTDWP